MACDSSHSNSAHLQPLDGGERTRQKNSPSRGLLLGSSATATTGLLFTRLLLLRLLLLLNTFLSQQSCQVRGSTVETKMAPASLPLCSLLFLRGAFGSERGKPSSPVQQTVMRAKGGFSAPERELPIEAIVNAASTLVPVDRRIFSCSHGYKLQHSA